MRGTGYKASLTGSCLNLILGLSHSVAIVAPLGVSVGVYSGIKLRVAGTNLCKVALTAGRIKSLKLPDVYKAKGILYRGERVNIKVGKRR